jgi:hypothetical protein
METIIREPAPDSGVAARCRYAHVNRHTRKWCVAEVAFAGAYSSIRVPTPASTASRYASSAAAASSATWPMAL